MIPELHSETQRIEHIFNLAGNLPQEEEILSHWARYLCVLTSGLIETCLRVLFSEYARTHSSNEVYNFVFNQLKYVTNVNIEKIRQLLGSFNPEWADDFTHSITDAQKDAIDSVLANRHNIAHGRSVGISLVRVKDYYDLTIEVLDWISQRVTGT